MTNDERKLERKQITLRIPDEVYGALERISRETGISIHSLVLTALCYRFGIFSNNLQ